MQIDRNLLLRAGGFAVIAVLLVLFLLWLAQLTPAQAQDGLACSDEYSETCCSVQKKLADQGLYEGEIDCRNGPQTRAAVRQFQRANRLHIDGQVGEDTRCRILGNCRDREVAEEPAPEERADQGEDNGYEPIAEEEGLNPGRRCKAQVIQAESNGRPFKRYAEGNAREVWSSNVDSMFGAEWARTKNARDLRMKCFESSNEGDAITIYKCRIRAIPCTAD